MTEVDCFPDFAVDMYWHLMHSAERGPNDPSWLAYRLVHFKGYDFKDLKNHVRTQVKVITSENKKGRSVRLVEPWDQLVLLLLDQTYCISKIGILSKKAFIEARRKHPNLSPSPFVKISMLGKKGLIGRFGIVKQSKDLH